MTHILAGVIAAMATPITPDHEPDLAKCVRLAKYLLNNGCDGLNVLGTTGEATSFSRDQRKRVMTAVAEGADASKMMVGTGAASLDDAIALTRHAASLGYAGALVLPPFYYKGVPDEGVARYFDAIISASTSPAIPIYLYHYPALSGVPFHPGLVDALLLQSQGRIVGLKDSSGDMDYARAITAAHSELAVFPSTEAILLEARAGRFAGCISATANLNSGLCRKAFHTGDPVALERAVAIRSLFNGKQLVAGVKAGLAHLSGDPSLALPMPPLAAWSSDDGARLAADLDRLLAE